MSTSKKRTVADKTRDNILEAAHKLFVAHGFSGTSISMIAKSAKINQSLIYHHFGNKAKLWQLIKMEPVSQFQELKGLDIPTILEIDDLETFIEKLVTLRFELYDNNPDLRRILDWQFLETPKHHLQGFHKETILQMLSVIKKFQSRGDITKEFDTKIILISLLTFPLTFFRGMLGIHENLETLSHKKSLELKQQFLSFCINCLKKGLIP